MNFTIAALMGAAVVQASEGGPYGGPSYGRSSYGRRGPAPYGRGPAPYGRGPAPYGPGPSPLGYGKLPGYAKKAAPIKKVSYKADYSSDSSSDDGAYKIPYGGPARGGYAGRGRLGLRGAPYGGPGPVKGRFSGPAKGAYFGPGRLGLGKKAYAADPYSSDSSSDDDKKHSLPYGGPRKAPYGGPAYGRAPYGRAPYGRGPAPYAGPKVADPYSSASSSDNEYGYNVAPKSPFGGKPAYAGPLPYGKAPVKKVVGGYTSAGSAFKLPAYGAKGPVLPVHKAKPLHGHGPVYGKGHRVSHSVVPYDPHALKVAKKGDVGSAPYSLGSRGPVFAPGDKGAYVMDQQWKGYGPNTNGSYNLNNTAMLNGVRALNTKDDPRGVKDVRGFGGVNKVEPAA